MTTADEESRKVALISSKVLNNAMEGYTVQKQKETMSSKLKKCGSEGSICHLGILQNVCCDLAIVMKRAAKGIDDAFAKHQDSWHRYTVSINNLL